MASMNGKMPLIDTGVGSIMIQEVNTIWGRNHVSECIKGRKQAEIGSVVVVEDDKPAGIFTGRDLLQLILSQQRPLFESLSEYITIATREKPKTVVGKLGIEKPTSRMEE